MVGCSVALVALEDVAVDLGFHVEGWLDLGRSQAVGGRCRDIRLDVMKGIEVGILVEGGRCKPWVHGLDVIVGLLPEVTLYLDWVGLAMSLRPNTRQHQLHTHVVLGSKQCFMRFRLLQKEMMKPSTERWECVTQRVGSVDGVSP